MSEKWSLHIEVQRQKRQEQPHFDRFDLEISPEATVLDAVEMLWAFKDRSLCFGHACHHSTCGACGMRVNGVEKLTCITLIGEVTRNGGTLRLQPLRNLPVVSDLVVDLTPLYHRMAQVKHPSVHLVEENEGVASWQTVQAGENDSPYTRLADCIECGLCISVCPAAMTSPAYIGPAVLAGAQLAGLMDEQVCAIADNQNGAWRCHSAYECSEVCPSHVQPAHRIMQLRRQLLSQRIRRFFGLQSFHQRKQ